MMIYREGFEVSERQKELDDFFKNSPYFSKIKMNKYFIKNSGSGDYPTHILTRRFNGEVGKIIVKVKDPKIRLNYTVIEYLESKHISKEFKKYILFNLDMFSTPTKQPQGWAIYENIGIGLANANAIKGLVLK